jgi:hypothetical protein
MEEQVGRMDLWRWILQIEAHFDIWRDGRKDINGMLGG